MRRLRSAYAALEKKIQWRYAPLVLGGLFFLEAIFFPTADPFLIFFCLQQPHKAFIYATFATGFSVLGACASYILGGLVWHYTQNALMHNSVITYFVEPTTFAYVCAQFQHYAWWSMIIMGFMPIPYKMVTFAAGFCRIGIAPLLVCSFITRSIRCFAIAAVITTWGHSIKKTIDRHFTTLVCIGGILLFLFLSYWFYNHHTLFLTTH